MIRSTHANHHSARSPEPTPKAPASDNHIAGPGMGTTWSESSALASAGASGRHHEPGSRPASTCPAQLPSEFGGQSPGVAKGTTAPGKPTRAARATGPDEARHARQARCRPQPRHRNRCQATTANVCPKPGQRAQHATNHGMRTVARQHQPPSGWTCAPRAASPVPAGYGTATVQMDDCAPRSVPSSCALGGYPAPASYIKPPSGLTSVPSAATPCILNTAHPARAPLNRSQVAQDTAHATPKAQRTQRETGATWDRTPKTPHNTPSVRTGEQEPSGPGNCTRNITRRAYTPVNGSNVAQDTAHATQHAERAHR